MVIALVATTLLVVAVFVLASRSFRFFTGAVKSSDFRNAREAAEYGASEITNALNADGNNYLLVTQPPCWQSSTLSMVGFDMPNGAIPGPNKITGVVSNTDATRRWKVLGADAATAQASGNYSRYQLSGYQAPRRANDTIDQTFSDSCGTNTFANRFGGSAYLTIKAEVYRKNQLVSSHTITQEVHVKGLLASSTGETSLVISNSADLQNTSLFLDLNNNTLKDTNEPWIDVICEYCTAERQDDLRENRADQIPSGIGLSPNSPYGGKIIKGRFDKEPFRFGDLNGNGIYDPSIGNQEKTIPIDLYESLKAKLTSFSITSEKGNPEFSLNGGSDPGTGSNAIPNNNIANIPLYSFIGSSYVDTGARANIRFCPNSGNGSDTGTCSSTLWGDIAQVQVAQSGSLQAGTSYIRLSDVCSLTRPNPVSRSWCTSTYSKLTATSVPSTLDPIINAPSLQGDLLCYPYENSTGCGSRILRQECAQAIDPINKKPYIGCVVLDAPFNSNEASTVRVITNITGIPVYIYFQKVTCPTGPRSCPNNRDETISFSGNDNLLNWNTNTNSSWNRPDLLVLLGLPPLSENTTADECPYQVISLNGTGTIGQNTTSSLDGMFAWFPRGSVSGSGNIYLKGILWACSFNGVGNAKFMGSDFRPFQNLCGENEPCGIYKYRAQGIAQIDRRQ